MQRKRKYTPRDVVDAIFWTLRVGSQWRNLPESFPKWESVYYYFRKWKADSTLENLTLALNRLERERIGKESTPSLFCIDSQSIKSAPFVKEDKGIDGNKKVNGRKRHIITDTWDPPEGNRCWALHLLKERIIALGYVESISHESIRQMLEKKTS